LNGWNPIFYRVVGSMETFHIKFHPVRSFLVLKQVRIVFVADFFVSNGVTFPVV